jgi:hypothetical protein
MRLVEMDSEGKYWEGRVGEHRLRLMLTRTGEGAMLRRLDFPAVELEGFNIPPFWMAKLPITFEANGSESSRYNDLQTGSWRRVVCICSWESRLSGNCRGSVTPSNYVDGL